VGGSGYLFAAKFRAWGTTGSVGVLHNYVDATRFFLSGIAAASDSCRSVTRRRLAGSDTASLSFSSTFPLVQGEWYQMRVVQNSATSIIVSVGGAHNSTTLLQQTQASGVDFGLSNNGVPLKGRFGMHCSGDLECEFDELVVLDVQNGPLSTYSGNPGIYCHPNCGRAGAQGQSLCRCCQCGCSDLYQPGVGVCASASCTQTYCPA